MCLKVQRATRGGVATAALWEARQNRRAGAQPLVQFGRRLAKLKPNRLLFLRRQLQIGQEVVDKKPVAQICGNAACARVWMGEQPHALQRRQIVANRGGADAEIVAPHDACAAHRLGGLYEFLNDNPQHLPLALGK